MEPYCPFGVGGGYCVPGEENCPFEGMTCPSTDARWGVAGKGDILVPKQIVYSIPFNPDPTDESKPKSMYSNAPGVPAIIGVHLSGIDMQGPVEAGGINVDIAGLPLPCGGHVTPPVGTGPMYHFHKAAYCLVEFLHAKKSQNGHSPLVGYANDGFGIYAWKDVDGKEPVLDECNGHFGPNADGKVEYHYHMLNVTNAKGKEFVPYYLGCQGPAKGKCKDTADPRGQSWCGPGCGDQLCVQPGTEPAQLKSYISQYADPSWLDKFTINPYHS